MAGIFISYRRGQAGGYAGRLADELTRRYGKANIFRDIEAISAGSDFTLAIESAVSSCDALIVVITPGWTDVRDEEGRRRLDSPEDFVRVEVESALARDTWVIPVLVGDATMPSSDELPESLKPLARRQAQEIRDASWEFNVDQLVNTLAKKGVKPRQQMSEAPARKGGGPSAATSRFVKLAGIAAGAVALLVVLVVASSLTNRDGGSPTDNAGLVPEDGKGPIEKASEREELPTTPDDRPPARESRPEVARTSPESKPGKPEAADPVTLHRRDIEVTIERASDAAIRAVRELNPQYVMGLYGGEALDSVISFIQVLRMNGTHAAVTDYGREIEMIRVSGDGRRAEVDLTEMSSLELHLNMDDSCVLMMPAYEMYETLYLERGPQGWYISSVDLHDDLPEPVQCSAF